MLRAGMSCRPSVSQVLLNDSRYYQREFHHLTTILCPGSKVVPIPVLSLPRRIKLNDILWREYRAVRSMLIRSGMTAVNTPSLRVLSSNFGAGFHTCAACNQGGGKDGDKNEDSKKDNKNDMQLFVKTMTYLTLALVLTLLFYPDEPAPSRASVVSWQEFVHKMLAKGEVQQIIVSADVGTANVILYENAVLNGKPVHSRIYTMRIPDVSRFEEKLRETEKQLNISAENGVPVVFERQKDSLWPTLAWSLLLGFIVLNMYGAAKSLKGLQMPWASFTKAKFTLVDPKLKGSGRDVRFSDIAGLKEAKQEVMEFVDFLKKPEVYRRLGAKVPKGSLLLGPPGCGKTLLAKAVATEADVPFLSMNGSEFIEIIGGLGATRVRDLFKEARKRAPCIVYIDEIDAIGGKRSAEDFGTSEKIQTLLQLLIELDGMATNEGVIMLASTNRAEVLDEALLRPGRFDRHILIGQPTLEERKEIFEVYLKRLQLDNTPSHYSGRLAQLTPTYSGADIANICNEAALHAAGLCQKKITATDLEYAVSRVKFGREKQERTIFDDERKQIAYYQAGRTIVGWMLKNTDALMKVSIIQYTSGIGSMQHFRPSSFLSFKEELIDRMTMYLGGKAAELLVFKQNSTQSEADLKKVSKVAYSMITDYGMNDVVGEVSFSHLQGNFRKGPFYSRKLHGIIDFEARKLIAQSFMTAEEILKKNAEKLDKLAEELLKRETLSYNEICDLIGPPAYGHKNLVDIIEFGAESLSTSGEPDSVSTSDTNPPSDNSSKSSSSEK